MPGESELVLACWQPHYNPMTKELVADHFACRHCPESNRSVRKKGNGYTNLKTHLIDKHKKHWMDSARQILTGEAWGPIDLMFGATDKAKQIHAERVIDDMLGDQTLVNDESDGEKEDDEYDDE